MEHFTEHFDRKSFSIHDIHYLNFQAVHSLLIRLELLNSTDKDYLSKELDVVAKKQNFELIINALPETSVVSSGHQIYSNLVESVNSSANTNKIILRPPEEATSRNRDQPIGHK